MNKSSKPENDAPQDQYFPIRTVSEITGVNSITLRAWERRYGLLVPHRTPKGHRLYTQDDIDLIHQTVELLNKGISISQVKNHLLPKKIQKKPKKEKAVEEFPNIWLQYQQRILNAIVRFDNSALMHTYNEILAVYPLDIVTTHLILPISRKLGDRWEKNEGTIAEEHFFTQFLRNKIGARFHHQQLKSNGPKIIAACFPTEQHEVGLLIFCLTAIEQGFDIVMLGSNLPLSELPAVATSTDADGIVLSGTNELKKDILDNELNKLIENVDIPVFVGGLISVTSCDTIKTLGALPLGKDFGHALKEINEHLHWSD